MRKKLLLMASFVLAVLVFTASAAAASGTPDATPAPRRVFTLFHETWCVGDVSPATPCDVTIGASGIHRTGTHEALDATSTDPIDRLRSAVRTGTGQLVLTPLDKALRLEEKLRTAPAPRR